MMYELRRDCLGVLCLLFLCLSFLVVPAERGGLCLSIWGLVMLGLLPCLGAVLVTMLVAGASLGCGGRNAVRRGNGCWWLLMAVAAMNQDGLFGVRLAL